MGREVGNWPSNSFLITELFDFPVVDYAFFGDQSQHSSSAGMYTLRVDISYRIEDGKGKFWLSLTGSLVGTVFEGRDMRY
jgi:hypothetical protein